MSTLTVEQLRKALDYDPRTGTFVWLVAKRGTARGTTAGTLNSNGYITIAVCGRLYKAHRLAWFHIHGEWPPNDIDHVNGIRTDNRLENLRLATRSQNCANKSSHRRDNTSGVKGVTWDKGRQKWMAKIQVAGDHKFLGRFTSLEEAADSYRRAAIVHFGQFAAGPNQPNGSRDHDNT